MELVARVYESTAGRCTGYATMSTPIGIGDVVLVDTPSRLVGIVVESTITPTIAPYALGSSGTFENPDDIADFHPEIRTFSQHRIAVVVVRTLDGVSGVSFAVGLGTGIWYDPGYIQYVTDPDDSWLMRLCMQSGSDRYIWHCVQRIITTLWRGRHIDHNGVLALMHRCVSMHPIPLPQIRSFLQEIESIVH